MSRCPLFRAVSVALVASLFASVVAGQHEALAKLPPDAEVGEVELPGVAGGEEPFVLPGEGRVRALAGFPDEVWVLRGERLFAVTVAEGAVRESVAAPYTWLALTADDRNVFVLQRRSVHVMDRQAMQSVREFPLPHGDEMAPLAIGAHGSELFVLWPDRITAIDKRTGAARDLAAPRTKPQWLGSDGERMFGGDAAGFGVVDVSRPFVEEAQPVGDPHGLLRGLAVRPRTAAVGAFVGARVLLVREERGGGGADAGVSATFVSPDMAWAREKLSVKIHARNDGVHYEIGPKPVDSLPQLQRELQRIALLPTARVPDLEGKHVLMPVVIESYPGTKVRDLLSAHECVVESGFTVVALAAAGRAGRWVTPAVEPAPPPPPRLRIW